MRAELPGLNPERVLCLMRDAVESCGLRLDDMVIVTEAATGAYAVTPVLAAMAGARKVFAISRSSRYGAAEEAVDVIEGLAGPGGVKERIEFVTGRSRDLVSRADIITNSGHVRPISAEMISWMKPTAVIPLMYEAWEFRKEDVDMAACRERGIAVAGTNERHPMIDTFSFLGGMAVKLLMDAGIAVYSSSILLLCDNPFASFIERGLVAAGADVEMSGSMPERGKDGGYDAVLCALQPRSKPVLAGKEAEELADRWPGAVFVQFFGDVDRQAFLSSGVPVWPLEAPARGCMGILPSDIGPKPVIRLQTGGLKVGEELCRNRLAGASAAACEEQMANSVWGQRLEV